MAADRPPHRWHALAAIALAQVGAMSTWFSAAAVGPALARDWGLSPAAIGLLTVAVQLGFVAGGLAAAITGVADLISPRRVFVASALAAAAANALLMAADGRLPVAVALRFGLGFFLAGVYPTGMKLMTEWFRADRGLAIGALVGALTLGSAVPHALAGLGVGGALAWPRVIAATSAGAVLSGAIVAAFVRPGPYAVRADRLDLAWAIRALRQPGLRLANLGYLGHMWELYAMWAWLPAFLLASLRVWDPAVTEAEALRWASLAAGAAIGAGGVGCVGAGIAADRLGRTGVTAAAMTVSGGCALAAAAAFGHAPWLVLAVAFVWGVAVIADSAQFSASVSELADRDRIGSALALQTALGFLLTAASIQVVPLIASRAGWPVAAAALAPGPALGAVAMLRLRRRPEAARLAGGRG